MNFQRFMHEQAKSWSQAWDSMLRLPIQARSVLALILLAALLATALALSAVFSWWVESVSETSTSKPRISRLLGYIEVTSQLEQALSETEGALSLVAIEDTGDSGRGGALLQQQLRSLANEAGLVVVGSEVREAEPLDLLVRLSATIQVTGSPASIDSFTGLLLQASPAMFPQQILLQSPRRMSRRRSSDNLGVQEANISASLKISAYRLGELNVD